MTRAVTLHQPWASLIAIGAKTIETRSWSTSYRGPLVIHAGARPPTASDFEDTIPGRAGWIGAYNLGKWAEEVVHADPCDCDEDEEQVGERCMAASEWSWALFDGNASHAFALPVATLLPLGAIVATCTLADVVPIVAGDSLRVGWDGEHALRVTDVEGRLLYLRGVQKGPNPEDWSVVSMLDDQRPYGDFARGRFAWVLEDVKATTERCPACWGKGWHDRRRIGPGSTTEPVGCRLCAGEPERVCPPVPARGKQGLWTWTGEVAA